MRFLYVFLSYLLVSALNAQEFRLKPGKVPKHDLLATSCPIDSAADAFIIFDKGHSYININSRGKFELIHTREVRIKVLNMNGADIANWEIPLYKSKDRAEVIHQVKAYTYNLKNGKEEKIKMDKDLVHQEDLNPQHNLVKFAIPGVEKGSIIDIEYTLTSPFYYNFQPWKFQSKYPTLFSEYTAEIPDFFEYNTHIQGFADVKEEQVKYRSREYRFPKDYIFQAPTSIQDRQGIYNSRSAIKVYSAENVPAIREEPFISSLINYISRISFELSSMKFRHSTTDPFSQNWEEVDKLLTEDSRFGKIINLSNPVNSNGPDENKPGIEEIDRIYRQTRSSTKWNNRFNIFSTEENFNDVRMGKEGSSGDINLNLIAKCRLAGLEAYPVICSTRKNGLVFSNNPSINQFNHTIAAVLIDSQIVLMDLTGVNNTPGILPFHTLNGIGRLIIDGRGQWIRLNPTRVEKDKYYFQLKCDLENNKLDVVSKFDLQDNNALAKRNYFASKNNTADRLKMLRQDYPNLDMDSLYVNEAIERDLSMFMTFSSRSHLEKAGDRLIVNSFLMNEILEDQFLEEDRLYPIELGAPIAKIFKLSIEIPEGYELPVTPEPMHITLPDNKGEFYYKCQTLGNQIQIIYSVNLNDTFYPVMDYPIIKQFFTLLMEKANEPLILVET